MEVVIAMLWEEAGHIFVFVMATFGGLILVGIIVGTLYEKWRKS